MNLLNKWIWCILLLTLLSGCTAKVAPTDESGLQPHISVDLVLPNDLEIGKSNVFSIKVSKSNEPLEHAEAAEFVIWEENHKESAVTIKANEASPGIYSASYAIEAEGLYLVQSRIKFTDAQVMPTKRFAIGAQALERLAQLESAQPNNVPFPATGHH